MVLALRLIACGLFLLPALNAKTFGVLPPVAGGIQLAATSAPQLPGPPYPKEAMENRTQGVTVVKVVWNDDGYVHSCSVVTSSGSELLDANTVSFIKSHWMSPQMAGKSLQTPITYRLQSTTQNARGPLPKNSSLTNLLLGEGFSEAKGMDADTGNVTFYQVFVNGKPFNLELSTGSRSSLIIKDAAHREGLTTRPGDPDPPPAFEISAYADPDKMETLEASTMQLGPQACIPGKIRVADWPLRKFRGEVVYDGHLGLDFLRANHAVILVNPPRLFLNPKRAASPALAIWLRSCQSTAVPLEFYDGHYFLPVRMEGYPARMILHTAAYYSMAKAQLMEIYHFERRGYRSSAGSVDISEFEVGNFPFGPATFQTRWARDPDSDVAPYERATSKDPLAHSTQPGDWHSDGYLGADLLGSVYTIIDCGANQSYFHSPPPEK